MIKNEVIPMKCSICGTEALPGAERCPTCGCRYQAQNAVPDYPREPVSPYDPAYQRPAKKKKTWLWILIPLVLVFLLLMGSILFVLMTLFARLDETHIVEPEATISARPELPEKAPTDDSETAPETCFVLRGGALTFLPERYDGGPVLRVPETIGSEAVTTIGEDCFRNCEAITTIILPDTVTGIDDRAFAGCGKLRGLYVPDGTKYIGEDVFDGCVSLESICIPGSVESIAAGTFDDCAALTYIFYRGLYEDWTGLYSDYIMPYTYIFCLDGDYYHSVH